MIYPDFTLDFARFFREAALNLFLANNMQDFRISVLHNCIVLFDTEQACLKLQVTNFKNKEVTP